MATASVAYTQSGLRIERILGIIYCLSAFRTSILASLMSRTSLPAGSFWRITIPVFVVFVLLNYLPVLRGKVPFPRDLVLTHAAWNGMRPETIRSYAGIIDVAA